ncbi:MAG: DUF2924 domain-containing protein [candidate division Zixibacteria bacterium]|nr:DUF2924 domain-containing protein [candidate division Zixibacteria bacterium]MBU1470403.1 DUF2924 domain-containing protein [candidate division Zixibacteria bacterium]MBU2626028.1 DUF2924 domain-containing protein [candidate division Zixibacteria bacterium]
MKDKSKTQKERPAWSKVSDLQKMGLDELRAEYERVIGKPTKSRNRKQLFAQISRKLQEAAKGSGSGNTVLTAKFQTKGKQPKENGGSKQQEKRQTRPIGSRDPRLPKTGTTITKKYKGKTINVRVLTKGFECQGREFPSLSAVAKHITGAIWNGFLFFGLIERQGKKS